MRRRLTTLLFAVTVSVLALSSFFVHLSGDPLSVRRLRPFYSPRLIGSSDAPIPRSEGSDRSAEMIRWSPLVYDAISTPDDIVVFAKGVNTRQGANAAEVRCVYYSVHGGAAPSSSAQEVFRCPHPPPEALSRTFSSPLRISLAIAPDFSPAIPSVANYHPPRVPPRGELGNTPRSLICACTMVYNAAKFLREWVAYHAAVGVDRFYVYDNASDDDLVPAVDRLVSEGFNVSARYWPWPKAQEAGFSHCAAVSRAECEWMAFIDVDEFVFSPNWAGSARPARSMLGSVVSVPPSVGQVSIDCHVFGPSGQTAHPKGGVTQGYTCRQLAEERHKSFIRLDAVDRSLVNSVHHFGLKEGFRTVKARSVRVNHYKYQVWDEFKLKFRRRASTYVADWTNTVNAGSRDRTPGLGFEAVEPAGWSQKFCEVNDTRLKDTNQKWFGAVGPSGEYRMAWE
ncbi:glycosyltransferase family 92 protein At1g27200-like [Ananas comosus]|uniref:Glycosyltransferase family 92 protein n=1 Tax=Ananas comosus TaxID=4615 RepID=A0A6P5H3K0_ANACO|nr:glycosyltransferase family 92 protein At1g27200-like [Ananas comosus]